MLCSAFERTLRAIEYAESFADLRYCGLASAETERLADVSTQWESAMRSGARRLHALLAAFREARGGDLRALPRLEGQGGRESLILLCEWIEYACEAGADRVAFEAEAPVLDALFADAITPEASPQSHKIMLDAESLTVRIGSECFRLSAQEFQAAKVLCEAPGHRVSKQRLETALRLPDFKRSRVFRGKWGTRFREYVKQEAGEVWIALPGQ